MGMQYDVKASKPLTATGQAKDQNNNDLNRVRIKTVYGVSGANAGSVVFRSGGATGEVLMTMNTPTAVSSGTFWLPLPGEGILAQDDVHVTITDVASVVVIYG
jgi:hypothetical protein